ncbi:MAG: hypothetical protein HDQ97_01415 [Lachnospiraceae bacterium]|nr:hypothetical protein [Lachnospiraceae bacterium]
MRELRLYAYRVGHGLCTLLHGINDDGSPYNAVFDCGYQPICKGVDYNGFNINDNYINSVLQHMASVILQGGNNHLDMLVCSHQDVDHNNLIVKLLSFLNQWIEPINKNHWLRCGDCSMINGYTRDTKIITGNSQGLITYEYNNSFFCSDKVNIIQNVTLQENDLYNNEFCAEATNDGLRNVGDPDILAPKFKIKIEANITQKKKEKNSWVKYTKITGYINFNDIAFKKEWTSTNRVTFSDWYDDVMAYFRNFFIKEFGLCYDVKEYRKIISGFLSWLKGLRAFYFKVPDIMYDCNSLSCLISQIDSLSWASFKLDSVIMGGYSEQDEYNVLKNFIHKYVKHIVPGREFKTFDQYKYLNLSFDGLSQDSSVDAEEIVATYDISDSNDITSLSTKYNATSVVVNFTYYDCANKYKSILFPGDVTVHNQKDVASKLKASGADCQYVFAPHHGSYNSNFLIDKCYNIRTDTEQPLIDLYEAMGSGVSTIFSECINNINYHTPRKEFYSIALEFAPDDPCKHKVYMYKVNTELNTWCKEEIEIEKGIYLTGLTFCYVSKELINGNSNDSMIETGKKYFGKTDRPQIDMPSNDLFV